MRILLDVNKSANENAQLLFAKAKEAKRKKEAIEAAILEAEKKIRKLRTAESFIVAPPEKKIAIRVAKEKQWFERFRHFFTSDGLLVIAGRDAKQNELLFSKHFEDSDLFFHADVHGAPALILKGGKSASEKSLNEAAQFAACYSSAWKAGFASADVYSAEKEQVKKHSHGEYVAKGGFMIYGQKKWFRNEDLKLIIAETKEGSKGGFLRAFPGNYDFSKSKTEAVSKVSIVPADSEKREVARRILEILKVPNELKNEKFEELMLLIPGNSEIIS